MTGSKVLVDLLQGQGDALFEQFDLVIDILVGGVVWKGHVEAWNEDILLG